MRAPNTDCVIYFAGNAPPADPDVSNVRGGLYDHFRQGLEVSENPTHAHRYTATLDVPLDTDLRDGYPGADDYRVYVPDQDGQGYRVVFVERIRHFRGQHFKRVYLDKLPLTAIQCGTFGLPNTLYATIPLGTGCPCLDGISIPIVFDGLDTWFGETEACGAYSISFTFRKFPLASPFCQSFSLMVDFSEHGPPVGPVDPTSCACSIPVWEYGGIGFEEPGGECVGGIAVVITT
ncbi:MAG: hypothetical protein JNM56_15025 [Planctomycetia bacterium]|nr:hypothetical protein [Planctomycetia bacterium]